MKENDTTVDLDNLTPAHKQVANEFLDRIDSRQVNRARHGAKEQR